MGFERTKERTQREMDASQRIKEMVDPVVQTRALVGRVRDNGKRFDVELDGYFTAEELRLVADAMEPREGQQ